MIAAETSELLTLLRSSVLYGAVTASELVRIAPRLTLQRFSRGDIVIHEGEDGDRAFLVASGEAAVITRDLIDEEVTLTVFGPGDGFGEAALTENVKRSATVKAVTDLDLYVLDRAAFADLERGAPAFAALVRDHVDAVALDRILKKASPFARLGPDRIREIAGQLVAVHAAKGDDVMTEGDEGDRFYLIRTGRYQVLQGSRRVTELGPGDVFGEIALLTGGTRVATVRALEDGELLALGKREFLAIVNEETSFRAQMYELGKIRLRATTGQSLTTPDPVTTLMPYLDAKRRSRYWQMLLGGASIFALASFLSLAAAQPIAIIAALLLGSFLTPIVYVIYLVESDILATRPGTVIATFGLAALLGIPVSGLLQALIGFDPSQLHGALGIAAMEEVLKLLGVAWLLGRSSARFRMDGVVFGAAAGMGFAAFETVLFGLAYIDSPDTLLKTLGVRALLAPLGHGTWTAIVCAMIWSERSKGRLISAPVLGGLALAVGLHALWDWQPLAGLLPSLSLPASVLWFVGVGALGVLVLRALVHRATTEELSSIIALNPELAARRVTVAERVECMRCSQVAPAGAHYCVRCGAALHAPMPDRRRTPRTGAAPLAS